MVIVFVADLVTLSALTWLTCLERGSGLCELVINFLLLFKQHGFSVVTATYKLQEVVYSQRICLINFACSLLCLFFSVCLSFCVVGYSS